MSSTTYKYVDIIEIVYIADYDDCTSTEEHQPIPCCNDLTRCQAWFESSEFLIRVKKVFTFFLTNLGLVMLVTCYCLLGAVIFEWLERTNEIEVNRMFVLIFRMFVLILYFRLKRAFQKFENEFWKRYGKKSTPQMY